MHVMNALAGLILLAVGLGWLPVNVSTDQLIALVGAGTMFALANKEVDNGS